MRSHSLTPGSRFALLTGALCIAVACSTSEQRTRWGDAGAATASPSGQGGAAGKIPEKPRETSSGGRDAVGAAGTEDASGASGGDEAGDPTDVGSAGAGTALDAGIDGDVWDATSDASNADADSDASEEGAAGASSDAGATSPPPKDAGLPPLDCAGPDEPLPEPSEASVATRRDVQNILDGRCVYCHSAPTPPMGLVLTDVAGVVGARSEECDGKLRIQPGSAKNSYLIDKLTGHAQSPCGCFIGQRMPLDDDPLPTGELEVIRSWINAGAP